MMTVKEREVALKQMNQLVSAFYGARCADRKVTPCILARVGLEYLHERNHWYARGKVHALTTGSARCGR